MDGTVRYYSPALERVLGYRPNDLIGRNVFGAIHPDDVARVQAAMTWMAQHPGVTRDIELRLRHRDGTWHPFEAVGNCPLDEHNAGCIVVNARDITERKHVEAALRDSEGRYRTLVEGSIQGISVIDSQGIRVFANARLAQIFGYDDPRELLGKPARERIAPRERARLRQARLARFGGEALPSRFAYQGLRKDGTPIWLENVVSLIAWDGQPAQLTTLVDITERKAAEEARQRIEAQLHQAQKLEALGTLAGGVAHEFNNMLGVILGFAELTQYAMTHGSEARENLQQILVAGRRAKDIVQQLLTFSRPSDQVREPLVVAVVVQEVLTLLRATFPATITIEPQISAEPASVLANWTQLHQVVMTLCTNAEYAMRETGGALTIGVAPVEVDAAAAVHHPALHPGPYVRLSIRDTGPGMPRDTLERIFEPFFTTKGVGEGTGMGLAIAHGIVTSHGGAILVESAPGVGATFDIYLPRIAAVPAETSAAPADDLPRGTARILFVDDEAMLAQAGHGLLAQQGYTVAGYTSSQEALAAFQAAPHAFDLIVTDQTMPEMTGEALARALRHIRPDIPIVLCTGFSHVMNAEKAQALGMDAFLMKPFGARELAMTIQQVLTRRAGETA